MFSSIPVNFSIVWKTTKNQEILKEVNNFYSVRNFSFKWSGDLNISLPFNKGFILI